MIMYNYIKALHIISVIAWMAGLLYLPRLFVYHSENKQIELVTSIFKVMERRLYSYIMAPAAILTWISGIYIVIESHFYLQNWFKIKFVLVFIMSLVHLYLAHHIKLLSAGDFGRSPRFYRILNEIPTLLMIFIVALVVIKPAFSFY